MHRLLASTRILVLAMGLEACQQASPPTAAVVSTPFLDYGNFHTCVDQEAKLEVSRAFEKNDLIAIYGFHDSIDNKINADVFLICKQRAINGLTAFDDPSYVNTAIQLQVEIASRNKQQKQLVDDRAKADLDAPRLKAEEGEEIKVGTAYYACLNDHAKILSLNSNEPAQVIAQASFPSCSAERKALSEAYQRHDKPISIERMEGLFLPNILLSIIKARTQRALQSEQPPTKVETPI